MFRKRINAGIGAAYVAALLVLLAIYFWGDVEPIPKFLAKLSILILVAGAVFLLTSVKFFGLETTRRLCINLALTGVILALCLAVAEAATRYGYRDVTTTNIGCGYFSKRWQQKSPPRLNRWHFRERDFSVAPPDGVYRIAVVGDSITYGQGLPESDRMTNLLEHRLNQVGGGYEVLNFGQRGAETVHHIDFLRDAVLDIDPDFILLQWYVNDVEGRDKRGRPSGLTLAPSDMLHIILLDRSALYCLGQMAWNQIVAYLAVASSYDAYMIARFGDPESPDYQAYRKQLTTLIELARERGIPMGIMLYPGTAFLRGQPDAYRLAFLHDRVLETCAEYGILCLDLRDTLKTVEDPRLLELSVFDAHPSALNNRLMTEAVFQTYKETWGVDSRLQATE